jgi:hypothetical protein
MTKTVKKTGKEILTSITASVMLIAGASMIYKIAVVFFKVNLMDFPMAIAPTVFTHAAVILPLSLVLFIINLKNRSLKGVKK